MSACVGAWWWGVRQEASAQRRQLSAAGAHTKARVCVWCVAAGSQQESSIKVHKDGVCLPAGLARPPRRPPAAPARWRRCPRRQTPAAPPTSGRRTAPPAGSAAGTAGRRRGERCSSRCCGPAAGQDAADKGGGRARQLGSGEAGGVRGVVGRLALPPQLSHLTDGSNKEERGPVTRGGKGGGAADTACLPPRGVLQQPKAPAPCPPSSHRRQVPPQLRAGEAVQAHAGGHRHGQSQGRLHIPPAAAPGQRRRGRWAGRDGARWARPNREAGAEPRCLPSVHVLAPLLPRAGSLLRRAP